MNDPAFDLIIVGGGIGGIISLKYARDAGLRAVLLERSTGVGGIWRDLPAWQDIQFRREDWTLGDLPLEGESQPHILRNIDAWVDRFGLAPAIRLGEAVIRADVVPEGWRVTTGAGEYRARWMISATGGHNRPIIPEVERRAATVVEYHSSALRDPEELRGRRVTVVGGGASAYDLLDLCCTHGASRVTWVYRSTKWMRPTRRKKYFGTDMRLMARYQMLGRPIAEVNRRANETLRARYAKAGLEAILPARDFDIRRDQLIPGRPEMIRAFDRIDRHQGEVRGIDGQTVQLADGEAFETDLLLWGTGYAMDLGYLGVPSLSAAAGLKAIAARCYSGFRSADAPNLFFLAPGVLETNTSTPWAYAHVARSIVAHIRGAAVFVEPPRQEMRNHFEIVQMLARRDRRHYLPGLWNLKYLRYALFYPRERPMPIP
ncbi:MAG TPA: NAD(P)-binding domain-containing protein [Gemmatimonadales bacterium]|nr:NAD(P)-binding domain-containing protein [Gemmatimonadales bacterium]